MFNPRVSFMNFPISQRMRTVGNSMMQRSIPKIGRVYGSTSTIHSQEYFLLQGFLQTWIIYDKWKVQGQRTCKNLVLLNLSLASERMKEQGRKGVFPMV